MDIKQKILFESENLFMRLGLKSVSMDDVARHLGISKKTIYNYLKDKKDLVNQVIEAHFNKQETTCKYIFQNQLNPISQMLLIGQQIASDYKSLNPALMNDLRKYYPKSWDLMNSYRTNVVYGSILENLKIGIKQGFYRDDFNPEIVANLYLNLTESMVQSYLNKTEMDYSLLIHEMIIYHLHGVCTEKGLTYLKEHQSLLK